ncbi:DUF3135 domain-containing protein [Aliikangiella marina]|uniref:DUF3135 domain-containing protein n=1 Tax=Aliikangiella marina TaxID=1712262 RepID=A0A545T4J5_9GAMM|nr:DUF3135 domain-containing protein [Aliikangiella marina]TQV72143.1 DUF3135 domain-containing protein [Aliikangiella marina]
MQLSGNKDLESNSILRERFDFDKWKTLHETDPQKFELTRRLYMEKVIEMTSERNKRRMRGLVFQVDAIREKSNNPIKSCVDITKMMWDSFYQLHQLLNEFDVQVDYPVRKFEQPRTARLLEFRRR